MAGTRGSLVANMMTSLPVLAWTLFFLLLIDVGINYLFPYPKAVDIKPGQLANYFDYGRSIEGKIRRQIGVDDALSSAVSRAGWIKSLIEDAVPTRPGPDRNLLIASYGMSFSNHVVSAVARIDSRIDIRLLAGPGAPPNYAYAAYLLDRHHHEGKVVVLGVLASSVRGMGALSGMTWQFEGPAPYTFPKLTLSKKADEVLSEVWLDARSLGEFRATLNDPIRWNRLVEQLREADDFYDPFLFHQNLLDESSLVRLFRRGWAKYQSGIIEGRIHNAKGFVEESSYVATLRTLVSQFAKTAREDGKLPVVLLLDTKGYFDHLDRILVPILERENIPYVSTNAICPASNAANFVSDGHFTEAANDKIAQATYQLLVKHGVLSKRK